MFIKTSLIFMCIVYSIQAGIIAPIPSNTNVPCLDLDDNCHQFASLCDLIPLLKTRCPQTCGKCAVVQDAVDPCADDNGGCSHYCSGTNEASCSCREGFQLVYDGRTCVDIDECSTRNDTCLTSEVCVNTPGSYSCQYWNCESFGLGLKNYYKSNTCCRIKPEIIPADAGEASGNELFENLLKKDASSQWPWMGQILSNDNHQSRHVCGAVLIAESWLVTSALCVKNISRDSLKIALGDIRNAQFGNVPRADRVEKDVIQVNVHPDAATNDIALIQVDSPVQFNELIQPVHLPCGESPSVGSTCYVTGFGNLDYNQGQEDLSQHLKEIPLPIASSQYCNLVYGTTNFTFDSRTMMCAGHIEGGPDACIGDGGGPLVCQRADSCQWYLSGIVSSGKGCGEIGFPGIYTKVLLFENWIQNVLGDDFTDRCE